MNRNRKIADKYVANQIRKEMKRRKEEREKNGSKDSSAKP